MPDEVEDLAKTLSWTIGMIAQSGPEDRARIAAAYVEAQTLVAGIEKEDGSARPRIIACFKRSDAYRADDDACVGWILTAMQERVNEADLPDWRKLRKIIKQSVAVLPLASSTVH
jgi:hypothetical protein